MFYIMEILQDKKHMFNSLTVKMERQTDTGVDQNFFLQITSLHILENQCKTENLVQHFWSNLLAQGVRKA